MIAVVAVDLNGAIGRDGQLLFRIHADMRNFRKLTDHKVLIYGRKTLDTFPNKKPLPNRINLILSHSMEPRDGVLVCHSIAEALQYTQKVDQNDAAVIGGSTVYKEFEPYIDTVYLTQIDARVPNADTFFFPLTDWHETVLSEWMKEDGVRFRFLKYTR